MIIITATPEHLSQIAPLFNAYRMFYKQSPDIEAAKTFLSARLQNKDAVIFLAFWEEIPVGFAQLYFSFSSVSLLPLCILNDLYVVANYRRKGVGEALLRHTQEYCIEKKYKGVSLQTATDNPAQHLYEQTGWKKDTDLHYFWMNENVAL